MTTTEPFPVDRTDRDPTARHRPKSILFCPNCGHQNHLTGDWITDGTETLRCPVCDTVVSDR